MIINESKLYGQDHHERCLEYIQHFFQEGQFPYVRSVYAMGSVVTGDYVLGYSDLDIVVRVDEADLTELMEKLRILNTKLWIPAFHLLKPLDFPPPDLFFTIRLLAESRLLYGQDSLSQLPAISLPDLRAQLLLLLSQRVVSLRALCCSKAVETYKPDKTIHDAQKLCLLGLRALLMMRGDQNTARHPVIQQVTDSEGLLTSRQRDFFLELLARHEQQNYPLTLAERLSIFRQASELLEEIQHSIDKM
jgi:hypothetical protein